VVILLENIQIQALGILLDLLVLDQKFLLLEDDLKELPLFGREFFPVHPDLESGAGPLFLRVVIQKSILFLLQVLHTVSIVVDFAFELLALLLSTGLLPFLHGLEKSEAKCF